METPELHVDCYKDIMNFLPCGADAAALACVCQNARTALPLSKFHTMARVGRKGTVSEPASDTFAVTLHPGGLRLDQVVVPPGGSVLLLPGVYDDLSLHNQTEDLFIFGRGLAHVERANLAAVLWMAAGASVSVVGVSFRRAAATFEDAYDSALCCVGGRVRLQDCTVAAHPEVQTGVIFHDNEEVTMVNCIVLEGPVGCVSLLECSRFVASGCTFNGGGDKCRYGVNASFDKPPVVGAAVTLLGNRFPGFTAEKGGAVVLDSWQLGREGCVVMVDNAFVDGGEALVTVNGEGGAYARVLAEDAASRSSFGERWDAFAIKHELDVPDAFDVEVASGDDIGEAVKAYVSSFDSPSPWDKVPGIIRLHLLPGVHVANLDFNLNNHDVRGVEVWGFGRATLWSAVEAPTMSIKHEHCNVFGVNIMNDAFSSTIHLGPPTANSLFTASARYVTHAALYVSSMSPHLVEGCVIRAANGVAVGVEMGDLQMVGCELVDSAIGLKASLNLLSRPSLEACHVERNVTGLHLCGGARATLTKGTVVSDNGCRRGAELEPSDGYGVYIADAVERGTTCLTSFDSLVTCNSHGAIGGPAWAVGGAVREREQAICARTRQWDDAPAAPPPPKLFGI